MQQFTMVEAVEHARTLLDSIPYRGLENARKLADVDTILGGLAEKLREIDAAIQAETKKKEAAELEAKKAAREQQLREAEEQGETVVGGQTIRVNADGSVETLIP